MQIAIPQQISRADLFDRLALRPTKVNQGEVRLT